ncbi:DUF2007 domain-containing protein [Candidatus Sumerlaeota bacterium]|nr:DUF2007 domain-containing protein [Candidatus Sumerlaeota bacterium]
MNEEQLFCPKCGRTYPKDVRWCEHCAVKLVTSEALDATKSLFQEKTVTVHVADTPLQAEIFRQILETNGIICALVGEVPSAIFPFTVDGLAKVRIVVLESVADDAREIIQEAMATAETQETDLSETEEHDEDCDSQ